MIKGDPDGRFDGGIVGQFDPARGRGGSCLQMWINPTAKSAPKAAPTPMPKNNNAGPARDGGPPWIRRKFRAQYAAQTTPTTPKIAATPTMIRTRPIRPLVTAP
jgi:hypothetical protein